MKSFDFQPRPRIVFGVGLIERLGELARELGGRRVLVVTDPGIVAAGHVDRGVQSLRRAGLEVVVFDGVQENPTTEHVEAGLEVARSHAERGNEGKAPDGTGSLESRDHRSRLYTTPRVDKPPVPPDVETGLLAERSHAERGDESVGHAHASVGMAPEGIDLLVGLGGGSAMDCAKGINFLYTNGGRMADYWGFGKGVPTRSVGMRMKPLLPMIAVPTTAGTGSECQSFALIADPVTHQKMACGDKEALPRIALLDPELTVTQPRDVTAATGIDAISHAVESYVTSARNPISQMYSREAWRLLSANYQRVLAEPSDLDARGTMLLGASLAGMAIESSMLGATHACANPLTAHYGIAHGVAIGIMLPHVVRFNGPAVDPLYGELIAEIPSRVWDQIPGPSPGLKDEPSAVPLAAFLDALMASNGLPHCLLRCGIPSDDLPALAAEAAGQWTASFNPRPVSERELLTIYQRAYDLGSGD